MSESLSVVQATNQITGATGTLNSGVSGALSAVGAILFGGGGPVVLGSVAFDGFEVPSTIGWGGAQRLTVHKYPGGARTIDAMGPDDRDLSWSGIFLGFDAVSRARAVDAIRIAGVAVPLVWADFAYTVVVQTFEADYREQGHVPYRLSCVVLVNTTTQQDPAQVDPAQAVASDVFSALGLTTDSSTISALTSAASAVSAAIPTGLILGSSTYTAANVSLRSALSVCGSTQSAADAVLLAQSVAASGTGLISGSGGLTLALAAAQTSAQQVAALGYIGRAVANATIGAS